MRKKKLFRVFPSKSLAAMAQWVKQAAGMQEQQAARACMVINLLGKGENPHSVVLKVQVT